MSARYKVVSGINSILSVIGIELVRKSEIHRLRSEETKFRRLRRLIDRFQLEEELFLKPSFSESILPEGAESYLQPDNPRFVELKQKYLSLVHSLVDHSQWFVNRGVNLQFFRGDDAYVFQYRDMNTEIHHLLTAYYIRTIDNLSLLGILKEDDLFGAYTFTLNEESCVSRDLLDSIVEIYFLERTLGISRLSSANILDIGAGYGRLAYRMVKSLPNIEKVFCVDAVAESTFISEYYLRFRGVEKQAIVVPLYELENTLTNNCIDIAVNILSFSGCPLASITWWLDILVKYRIRYLMVVPHASEHGGTRLLTHEEDGSCLDFLQAINSRGYELIAQQPKYLDPNVQKHGVSPTYHYLFEITSQEST